MWKNIDFFSANVSSQIGGQIIKRNPSLSYPTRLAIGWFNFIEGDDIRYGNTGCGVFMGGIQFLAKNQL